MTNADQEVRNVWLKNSSVHGGIHCCSTCYGALVMTGVGSAVLGR